MKSDNVKAGMQQAPHRSLFNALGFTEEEMKNIKAFFESYGYPEKTELLPYHAMGEHKYEALGKTAEKFDAVAKDKIEKLKKGVSQ